MTRTSFYTCLGISLVATACVFDEPAELNDATGNQPTEASSFRYTMSATSIEGKSTSLPFENVFSILQFKFENRMPNLHLKVEGLQLHNIHRSGTYFYPDGKQNGFWITDTAKSSLDIPIEAFELAPGASTVLPVLGDIPFIPQSLKAWNPARNPLQDDGCYLILKSKIYNIIDTAKGYQEGKDIPIWGSDEKGAADAAIPLQIRLKPRQEQTVHITMEENCPWFHIGGETPQQLFVPITFDVSVEAWK